MNRRVLGPPEREVEILLPESRRDRLELLRRAVAGKLDVEMKGFGKRRPSRTGS